VLPGTPSSCVVACTANQRFECQRRALDKTDGKDVDKIFFEHGGKDVEKCSRSFFGDNEGEDDGESVSSSSSFVSTSVTSEVYVSPLSATTISSMVVSSDDRPKYSTFQGSCGTFHEGLLLGTGIGISKFTANSIDECWALCDSFAPECTQVEFHIETQECTLGDAISTTFHVDVNMLCRTLDYMPIESTNGLPGMMLTDSVGDGKDWFTSGTVPQLVGSLEECQALCKAIDSGHDDSACMYGGYVDCSSFYSSFCTTGDGIGNADCQKCQANQSGGICRLPSMSSSPRASDNGPPRGGGPLGGPAGTITAGGSSPPCPGGNKCRWFEKSAPGYSVSLKTPVNQKMNFLPDTSNSCSSRPYLPNPISTDNGTCYLPVKSLWHCQSLCTASNRMNGSGRIKCIGGLYTDNEGSKRCQLAEYRKGKIFGKTCSQNNCAWFELDGMGTIGRLQDTGMKLAVDARSLSPMLFEIGVGGCSQFKTFGPRMKKSITQVLFNDPIKECSIACSVFPQCTAFQVTGQIEGAKPNACDITKGGETDCTSVECVLSSALTTVLPNTGEKNQICWSKTPTGTVDSGGPEIDYDNVDPGIPGFVTTNSRVRKFNWSSVVNKANLALTTSMEQCQSVCRTTDGCQSGTWQPCSAMQSYCEKAEQLNIATPELISTCNVCKAVKVSESQPSVAFPLNYGVCKVASGIGKSIEACQPEPCYAFETGSDIFYILSMTKNPFGTDTSPSYMFNGEVNTYVKASSLEECQQYCTPRKADDKSDPRYNCKYGMYIPRSNGYGECYLTESEIRENHGSFWQLRQDTTVPCNDGTCITFIKLVNQMPPQFTGAT